MCSRHFSRQNIFCQYFCPENVCLLHLLHISLQIAFIMEANTVIPDQTDLLGAVLSGSILFTIMLPKYNSAGETAEGKNHVLWEKC